MSTSTVDYRGVRYDAKLLATLATQGRLAKDIPTENITYTKGADTSQKVLVGVDSGDGKFVVLVGQMGATATQTLRVLSRIVLKKAVLVKPGEVQWERRTPQPIDTRFDAQSPNRRRDDPQAGLMNPLPLRFSS